MQVHIGRDSVCAADDVEQRRPSAVNVRSDTSIHDLVDRVKRKFHLPSIAGGRATWCLRTTEPIAVFAQQWDAPHVLSTAPAMAESLQDADGKVSLWFQYCAQDDPDEVVAALENGQRWELVRQLRRK